jgi:hypothetical protein
VYVAWGLLIAAALIVQWWGATRGISGVWPVWVAAGVTGTIVSAVARRGRAPTGKVVSLASRSIRTVWAMCSLAIWSLCFLGIPTGTIGARLIMPLIAILMSIAVVTTGATFHSRVFVAAGWLWFAGGLVALFLPVMVQFPVFLFLIAAGEILPGMWLWHVERSAHDAD